MRALVVLARAPSSAGKTRLTAGLSEASAYALREALLLDTLDSVRKVGVAITMSFTPSSARAEMARLAPDVRLVAQADGDLGARMKHAITSAFRDDVHAVVLVGSDIPVLPSQYVRDAFDCLERGSDVVIGPADDGGYYLVGCRRGVAIDPLFTGISWGTDRVLLETKAAVLGAMLQMTLVTAWFDVDDREDLASVIEHQHPDIARRTREWCDSHPSSR